MVFNTYYLSFYEFSHYMRMTSLGGKLPIILLCTSQKIFSYVFHYSLTNFVVTEEAVKKTKKKAQEGAIHSQVNGNFFIWLFNTRFRNVNFFVSNVNFLLGTSLC